MADQAHLCARQSVSQRCIGVLKFGDLVMQAIDFRDQRTHVFSLDWFGCADASAASPVPESAVI